MNILIAPNAMKGSLTAVQCASIIRNSLLKKYPDAQCTPLPVADGGNGTLECLLQALGGTMVEKEVTGILPGEKTLARFGILPDGTTAVIESAEVIGMHKLNPSPMTIANGTTFGIGELILEIVQRNCKKILVGLGGTATNDAGSGAARALGISFFDSRKNELPAGAIPLLRLHNISTSAQPLPSVQEIVLLSDVNNILLGPEGATFTFARQKGADEEQLPYLEAAVKNFAEITESVFKKEFRNIPGSGAAGGLGFGLLAFCNARITSGINFILDALSFDKELQRCDVILTTEGTLDEQTLYGKGTAGICARAEKYHKPVHAFVGKISGDKEKLKERLPLASLTQISPDTISTEEAMHNADWLLADAVYESPYI